MRDTDRQELLARAKAKLLERSNSGNSDRSNRQNWTNNLLSAIEPEQVEAAYSGDPDWQKDLADPHSSAALTSNLFLAWKGNLGDLVVCDLTEIKKLELEVSLPTGAGEPPAFFDGVAITRENAIGIEVKCLEYLADPPEKYRESYRASIEEICRVYGKSETGWLGVANHIKAGTSGYRVLFAAQLIKQAIGLLYNNPNGNHWLTYLYWEPLDWQQYRFFDDHRSELSHLKGITAGDRVQFRFMSIHALLQHWRKIFEGAPVWIDRHLRELTQRYDVSLSGT